MNNTHARMLEAIDAKEDLADLLNQIIKQNRKCPGVLGDAVWMVTQCYQIGRDNGYIPPSTDAEMAQFLSASLTRMAFDLNTSLNTNPDLAGQQLSHIVAGINQARAAGTRWVSSTVSAPIPVAIVSMPERITQTEIQRNPQNAIVGSRQTERDAA